MSEAMLQYIISTLLITATLCYPYRYYSPRSVPGRLRESSVPDSILDYISNYNSDYYRNQQSQYGIPEYEPSNQQAYASRRSHISPEAVAALLSYVSQNNANDYAYDLNSDPSTYSDDEGTWYDDSTSSLGYSNNFDNFDNYDRGSQDAAILQLYLDHLNGKYSLEDLETLEREAAMEDNTENQLQAYRTQKRSTVASIRHQPPLKVRKLPVFRARQGQKEEAYMVPATSIRRQRQQTEGPKENVNNKEQEKTSSTSTQSSTFAIEQAKRIKVSQDATTEGSTLASEPTESTTMEPLVKSAYDVLQRYLNKERRLRQTADEAEHMPQKRFVSEPESLSQQLASLKKTVT